MRRPKGHLRKRGNHKAEDMLHALEIHRAGSSLRQAAIRSNVKFCTLCRYAKKYATVPIEELKNQQLTPNYAINRVFSAEQEEVLKMFLEECAQNLNGLSGNEMRSATYEMAVAYKVDVPESWSKKKTAGIEWSRAFRERHPEFTLKKPDNIYRMELISNDVVKAFCDTHKVEVVVREKKNYISVEEWPVLAASSVQDEPGVELDRRPSSEEKKPPKFEEDSGVSVWSYFERESNGNARCAICRTVVPRVLMRNHMQENHPKLIVDNELVSDTEEASETQEDVYTEIVYLEDEAKRTPEKKKRPVSEKEPKPRKRQLSTSSDEVPLKQKKTEDEIEQFAKFITSLLKKLPAEDCMELQMEIVNMIMKKQLERKKKEAEAKMAEVAKNGECSRVNLDSSGTST